MGFQAIEVTRYPRGVTNVGEGDIFNSLKMPDPTLFHTYFNDFDHFVAADWTVTETQVGATQALTDGDGGLLLLTNTAADNDLNSIQKVGESFRFESGKKLFFKARVRVSNATQTDLVIGLVITDTTPLDVTDGVFFYKADDAATIALIAEKDNVQVSSGAIATLADATLVDLAFFYDGGDRIYYAVAGSVLGYISPSTSFPNDEDLTITLTLQNGSAVAHTLAIDYVFAAKER